MASESDAATCDRCPRTSEDVQIEQTLSGEQLCEVCQDEIRDRDRTRELGQSSLSQATENTDGE